MCGTALEGKVFGLECLLSVADVLALSEVARFCTFLAWHMNSAGTSWRLS